MSLCCGVSMARRGRAFLHPGFRSNHSGELAARPRALPIRRAAVAASAAGRPAGNPAEHGGTRRGGKDQARHPRRQDRGLDGLQARRAQAALPGPDRTRGDASGGVRPRPAHHREIRHRRLRAVTRDRAAAEFRAPRRHRTHPGDRGLCRQGGVARDAVAIPGLFHALRGDDHCRPPVERAHGRALSVARR